MSPQREAIQLLPDATQDRLRSTQILTSLPQIVSELVQNSVDAGARKIEVGVDCTEWMCWVKDDGNGINKEGLSVLARGERYHTSKAYNMASLDDVSTFGFRGEALASMADVACLEITSRTSRDRTPRTTIVKGRECLYEGSSARWSRNTPGTVVCVRDAFYNLPVRRHSHPNSAKTLEAIRKNIELISFVCPGIVFTLDDISSVPLKARANTRILTIPKTNSSLEAFQHINGRALTEHVDLIHASSGDWKLDGFISLIGTLSRNYQHFCTNKGSLWKIFLIDDFRCQQSCAFMVRHPFAD